MIRKIIMMITTKAATITTTMTVAMATTMMGRIGV